MTGRNTPSPDSVLHLLEEAGVDEDPALLEAVEDIAELAERPAPEPSAELTQLMAGGGRAPGSRRTKGRITFIGGALAVSMGVGMSGVAAGPADRHEEVDGSIDSVTRSWARDHVDRIAPGALAAPGVVAPPSSDAVGADSSAEAAPVPPVSGGGAARDGGLDVGSSEFDAGRPPSVPAAHPAPVPATVPGAPVPSPSRQSAPGGVASAGTPAPDTSAPHLPAPNGTDARASSPRSSAPEDGTGTSTGSAGAPGDAAAPGIAGVPNTAGDMPRLVEEPVGFATLAWVSEGPDDSTYEAATSLVWLRAPGAAPDNVVFLSEPMSEDGRWLALFIPDATELTWDPAAGEYVPWVPVAWESAPDAPSDLLPEKATPPIGQPEGLMGEESGEELVGDAQGSQTRAQAPVPESREIVPPPTDASEAAVDGKPVEAVPESNPSGDASGEELRAEPVLDDASAELHTTGPVPSSQEQTEQTEPTPGPSEQPTPALSGQPTIVPVDEPTVPVPNSSDDPAANEPPAEPAQ